MRGTFSFNIEYDKKRGRNVVLLQWRDESEEWVLASQ